MKKFINIIFVSIIITLYFNYGLLAQEKPNNITTESNIPLEDENNEKKKNEKIRNVNIDMQLVYGQYNNMLSIINYSHEQTDFVYLLSSYFKRSNDYGYKDQEYENSSYYENNIGFTGNINASETWKIILGASVDSDSHGMFDNSTYSREEKEKYKLSFKNIKKFSSYFEGYIDVGGAGYTHRLSGRQNSENVDSNLNKFNAELGGDFIWSASNRVKGSCKFTQYDYSDETVEKDQYFRAEISDDFIITNYIGINLGMFTTWHNDDDFLTLDSDKYELPVLPLVGLSLRGLKNISVIMKYKYDLIPFMPEEYFFAQKYVLPRYDLPPSTAHIGDCRINIRFNSVFSLKSELVYKKIDNFYNYYTISGNVLSAETIDATNYIAKVDNQINLFKRRVQFILGYEYNKFDAEQNITYRPNHSFNGTVKFVSKNVNLEWTNKISSQVYTEPTSDNKLEKAVLGIVGMQVKTMTSLYAYLRIENVYNNKYYLRDGYPEAGRTILGGLRILL